MFIVDEVDAVTGSEACRVLINRVGEVRFYYVPSYLENIKFMGFTGTLSQ